MISGTIFKLSKVFSSCPRVHTPIDTYELQRDVVNVADSQEKGIIDLIAVLDKNFSPLGDMGKRKLGEALLQERFWNADLTRDSFRDLDHVKDDLAFIFCNQLHGNLRINLLLQALCPNTFLGKLYHIARNAFGSPSIFKESSKLGKFALQLEQELKRPVPVKLEPSTIAALQTSSAFLELIAAHQVRFPHLYNFLQNNNLIVAPEPVSVRTLHVRLP